jgi:hypothetical protein
MPELRTADALELLCAIVRETPIAWPDIDMLAAERLYDIAREQGVHLLVAERLWQRGGLNDCPEVLRDRLVLSLRNQLAVEEIARRELREVLVALADAGIVPLLFKGTALAFTHYHDAALRPRFDTDLLIEASEIDIAAATLERLGYERGPFVAGDLVMYQAPFSRSDRRGVRHTFDVHWKISNPQVFAAAFTVDELRARAVSIPALGSGARAVGPVHALALACIHRLAHHGDDERLIWLYDIHLISEGLTASEREDFINLADAKQLMTVCRDGLAAAEQRFRGRGVALLLGTLEARKSGRPEQSEIYVTGRLRKVDVLVSDLKALDGWGARMKLLREHLFPPPSYMQQVYGVSSRALLPLVYVWRIANGAAGWWRRADRTRPTNNAHK